MIIDRLYENVRKLGNVCIGLDTDVAYIPEWFLKKFISYEEAVFEFNKKIIDATIDIAACYKVQIAYYEAYGIEGLNAYKKTLEYLRNLNAIIIADIKRGDIAKTAEMYAKAHFEGDFESDFITINPYMGMDSISPYIKYIEKHEKGLFALVRTSNKGAEDIQYIESKSGNKIYDIVGHKIHELGKQFKGECGYSSIGGVVGCTHADDALRIREEFRNMFFLIPGYGAQGGKGDDVKLYFKNGNGGIVNSSRGILLAYKKFGDKELIFDECARKAAIQMRDDILN